MDFGARRIDEENLLNKGWVKLEGQQLYETLPLNQKKEGARSKGLEKDTPFHPGNANDRETGRNYKKRNGAPSPESWEDNSIPFSIGGSPKGRMSDVNGIDALLRETLCAPRIHTLWANEEGVHRMSARERDNEVRLMEDLGESVVRRKERYIPYLYTPWVERGG